MANIEDLLRKRKEIEEEIRKNHTKPVTLLFTDIVGSTHYFETMGDIEGRDMIETHNKLLFPVITSYKGIIIKTIGDSIMASFDDPCKGVQCAIDMQCVLKEYNKNAEPVKQILVRMGLHYGKAVFDDKDLFGDMVNTSARVESRAEGQEILISSALMKKIDDHSFPLVFLGSDFVKGKKGKIEFYLVNWNQRLKDEVLKSWEKRIKKPDKQKSVHKTAQKIVIQKKITIKKLADNIKPLGRKGNPYLNRVMIPHPDMFFGRHSIIKRIMRRISAESPQSVSIVGERRIGKSSLLKYLNFPGTRFEYLDEPDKYIFLFIDFQQLRTIDEKQFIHTIFNELGKQPGYTIEITCENNYDSMRFLCEQITREGYKFIFFFDEFECVTKNEKIGPEFYSFFRSLANNFPLAFVTASGRNLKDMCVSHEISDSPFFNIFTVQHISLFTDKEAKKLITIPSEARGVPLEPLKDSIIELGGLYPFFLQMFCSAWYDFLEIEKENASEYVNKRIPREVINMFREEAYPHFEYICETLKDNELDILKQLVGSGQVDSESSPVEILEQKGYITRNDDDTFRLFSKEFNTFVIKIFSRG